MPVRFTTLFIAFNLWLCASASAQQKVGYDDTWLRPNSQVSSMVKLGNTLYLGGSFSSFGFAEPNGAQVDAITGQPDIEFANADGEVLASVPDGQGGWFIGGGFTSVGGKDRSGIAHLNADGTVNPWAPNLANIGGAVVSIVLAGNTLYAAGNFSNSGNRNKLVGINTTTGVITWAPQPNGDVAGIAISGNTLYIAGSFTSILGAQRTKLAAVDLTSLTLTALNDTITGQINNIAVSGNNVFICSPFLGSINGVACSNIAALDGTTGALKPFNPSFSPFSSIDRITTKGDMVYISGSFSTVNGASRNGLAALDTNGTLTSWNPFIFNASVQSLIVDNGVVYTGTSLFSGLPNSIAQRHFLAIDSATGVVDTSFLIQANSTIGAIAKSGTKFYLGGRFSLLNEIGRSRLAAIDLQTGKLTAWNPNVTSGNVTQLTTDGRSIYIAGISEINGVARFGLAVVDTAGTGTLGSWNPCTTPLSGINVMQYADGKIYLGGDFPSVNGITRNRMACIDTVGNLTSWNPDVDNSVRAMSIAANRVYIGGFFTNVGGQAHNRVAALDTAGAGAATAWDPNVNDLVLAIALQDSLVYLGGNFTTVGGQSRRFLAAVDSAGTGLVKSWNPQLSDISGIISGLAISGNIVHISGKFGISTPTRSKLASVNRTTGALNTWNPMVDEGSVSDPIRALIAEEEHVYVAGSFAIMNKDKSRFNIMHLIDSNTCIKPVLNATVTDATCISAHNGSINLQTTGGSAPFTFAWTSNAPGFAGATTEDIANILPGTYNVMVTADGGCTSTLTGLVVTGPDVPPVTPTLVVSASNNLICFGSATTFSASGTHLGTNPLIKWFRNGSFVSSSPNLTLSDISRTATDTIRAEITNIDEACATSSFVSDTIQVRAKALPSATTTVVTSSGATALCSGDTIKITATSGGVAGNLFQWSVDNVPVAGATSPLFTTTQAGNVTLTVTSAIGCSASSSRVITPHPDATITAHGPVSFCPGTSVTLSVPPQPGATYRWKVNSTNKGTADTQVAAIAGSWTVRVTNAGCITDATPFNVDGPKQTDKTVTVQGPLSFCTPNTVTLQAHTDAAYRYQWFKNNVALPADTLSTLIASSSGSYNVGISNDGCPELFSLSNTVKATITPTVTIKAHGPISFCPGGSVTLEAVGQQSSAITYRWKLNGVINKGTADNQVAAIAGSWTVRATNAGCIFDAAPFNVDGPKQTDKTVTVQGPLTFCTPNTVTLQAHNDPAYRYQWFKSSTALPADTQSALIVGASGSYKVSISNSGCLAVNSLSNTVTATITPVATIFQISSSQTFNKLRANSGGSTSGLTYQWFKNSVAIAGATLRDYTATQTGNYSVAITRGVCTDTSEEGKVVVPLGSPRLSAAEIEDDEEAIVVYPNPSDGIFNISADTLFEVRVTDLVGRSVITQSSELPIDLTNQPAGIYIFHFFQPDGALIKSIKVVKK